jgi:hypothetical protein
MLNNTLNAHNRPRFGSSPFVFIELIDRMGFAATVRLVMARAGGKG